MNAQPVKKTVLRPCPICFNDVGEILHTQKFAIPEGYPLPGSYDVVSCIKCGFVYADTSSKQKDYDVYYENFSKYEDLKMASGTGTMAWDKERCEGTASEIARLVPYKNSSIIDVGCANGGILAALKYKGYKNLAGLDPSQACIDHVQKGCAIDRVIRAGMFSPTLKSDKSLYQKFDCVILSHVIEHIYDLQGVIKNVSCLLKEGGVLYIEVPDASRYADYFIVPYYYFDCEHINHFDEHFLRNLLVLNGIEFVSSANKKVRVSASNIYPCISLMGRKPIGEYGKKEFIYGNTVKNSVLKYVERSKETENSIMVKLEALIKSQDPVIIFGAGSFTQRLLEESVLSKCNIKAFIDNNPKKWGSVINGIAVYPPDYLKKLAGTLVIISALFSDDIYAQAKDINIDKEVISLCSPIKGYPGLSMY